MDYAVFVSATDAVDGPVPVTCSPASGTVLPIGVTGRRILAVIET